MNEDGICYLDVGDAYVRGDWSMAINTIWSPLYSLILGLTMLILKPSIRWEFPVVHLVNFIIYVGTLVCFEFFWRQLTQYRRMNSRDESGESWITLPNWAWVSLGYILFIVSSLQLIEIWAVTPDMLMAAFVYLADGLVVRLRLGFDNWRTFILLGVVLGLSYLAKAVMFPLAFVFISVGLFSVGNIRRAAPKVLAALIFFLIISLPFIAAVYKTKGKLTFGDAGKLTYARYINGVPYPHWQGDPPGNGTPKHPSRKIFDAPPIYEFGSPIGGTYPISYDPSHWYEGVVARFDLKGQINYLLFSVLFYSELFFHQQAVLVAGLLLLYLMSRWERIPILDIVRQWALLIPALAAFSLYGLINVLGRYIGVFIVLFWADLLANVRLPESWISQNKLVSLVSITMVFIMMMNILTFNLEGLRKLLGMGNPHQFTVEQPGRPGSPGEVAQELHRLGVERGAKVGVIGYAFDSFWARLARVKIVAEMLGSEADEFWRGDASLQSDVIQAFESTGARAIVAEHVPGYARLEAWNRVGTSNYYIKILQD
ncbi:MAG: hypothetical protein ACYSR9_00580 [Planctomycetota bacterium]